MHASTGVSLLPLAAITILHLNKCPLHDSFRMHFGNALKNNKVRTKTEKSSKILLPFYITTTNDMMR